MTGVNLKKRASMFSIGKYSDKEGRAEEWFARGKMVSYLRLLKV
jgi:hypothetical protein